MSVTGGRRRGEQGADKLKRSETRHSESLWKRLRLNNGMNEKKAASYKRACPNSGPRKGELYEG